MLQAEWERKLEDATWLGIVEEPLCRFAESDHLLPPVLYMEIGIINKAIT